MRSPARSAPTSARRKIFVWALAGAQLLLAAADALTKHSGIMVSFYWIPVIISAIFATPRQVALLGALAFALGAWAELSHEHGRPGSIDHIGSIAAVVLASCVAVAIAKRQRDAARRREEASEKLAKEEKLLRTVLDNVGVHIYMKDAAGRFLYANPPMQKHLGRTAQEIVGRTNEDLLPPAAARAVSAMDNKAFTSDGGVREEEIVPDTSGEERVFLSTKFRLHLPGEDDRLVGFSTDITERKRAQAEREELQELRSRELLELTDSIPVGAYVVRLGPDGVPRFDFVSKRLLDILQVAPGDVNDLIRLNPQVFARKIPFHWEGKMLVGGATRWIRIESVPRELPGGGMAWTGVLTDITFRKQADERLVQREKELAEANAKLLAAQSRLLRERAQLRATLDSLLDPHVMLQPVNGPGGGITDFVVTDANPAACSHHRTRRMAYVGKRVLELYPPAGAAARMDIFCRLMKTGEPVVLNDFVYPGESRSDDIPRRFDIRAVKVDDSVSYTWRDVTDRYLAARRLAESEEHYRMLAENSSDVVLLLGPDEIIRWVSPSLTPTLGWRPADWIGRTCDEFLVGSGDECHLRNNRTLLLGGDPIVSREQVRAKSGDIHWIEVHASPHRNAAGQIDGVVSSFRTIDAEVAAEKDLERRARTDELTQLLNRNEAISRIERLTAGDERTGTSVAVLFCDLDRFKEINDSRGHGAGDEVLKAAAGRLRSMLRGTDDLAARLGGDELLVVLNGVQNMENALEIAEKLRARISEPVAVDGGEITVTMSIGVAMARPGESAYSIISRADAAMYRAKLSGRDQVVPITDDAAPGTPR